MDYLQYFPCLDGTKRGIREMSFKPYYKWITFNTMDDMSINYDIYNQVLNLIINGLPSILEKEVNQKTQKAIVLNLIINGLPSIQMKNLVMGWSDGVF